MMYIRKVNNTEHKSYHHGNLEEALIEAGIEIITREGPESLSLRRVAATCGVSHAAPYKHFKDKDSLILAMRNHIAGKFTAVLEASLTENRGIENSMIHLAQAYLGFFMENPHYFTFFQSQPVGRVNLSDLSEPSSYSPFEVFKGAALKWMDHFGVPPSRRNRALLSMWAMVHGTTSIATMRGIYYAGDWNKLLRDILEQHTKI